MHGPTGDSDAKDLQRATILARRRARDEVARAVAAEAIAAHVLAAPFARVARVATYLSMGTEPGTTPLINGLADRGVEVIVPIGGPDRTLDWVLFDPDADRVTSPIGVPEPAGTRLGPSAIADAGLVIVPALAVDHAGWRLGRGGGYFDRALPLATAPTCALLYADELVASVPHEDHDVPVDLVITESGVFRVQH